MTIVHGRPRSGLQLFLISRHVSFYDVKFLDSCHNFAVTILALILLRIDIKRGEENESTFTS